MGSIWTVSTGSFLNLNNTRRSTNKPRTAKPNLLISIFLVLSIIDSNGLRASWTKAASRSTDSTYWSLFDGRSVISSIASSSSKPASTSSIASSSSKSASTSAKTSSKASAITFDDSLSSSIAVLSALMAN